MPRTALTAALRSLALVSLALALGACSPDVPTAPTYARDVKPILMAHCVRCHDETLRAETLPDGGMGLGTPTRCHLNRLENGGDCSAAGMAADACSYGAQACASLIPAYVAAPGEARMPPLPAEGLNDWELEVLTRWGRISPAP